MPDSESSRVVVAALWQLVFWWRRAEQTGFEPATLSSSSVGHLAAPALVCKITLEAEKQEAERDSVTYLLCLSSDSLYNSGWPRTHNPPLSRQQSACATTIGKNQGSDLVCRTLGVPG